MAEGDFHPRGSADNLERQGGCDEVSAECDPVDTLSLVCGARSISLVMCNGCRRNNVS